MFVQSDRRNYVWIPIGIAALIVSVILFYIVMWQTNPLPYIFVDEKDIELQIYTLVNEERAKRNIAPLIWDTNLVNIARSHSNDMLERNYYSHVNPEGLDATARAQIAGYDCFKDYGSHYYDGVAENLLRHPYSLWRINSLSVDVMQMWMDEDGHAENILESEYERIGIGVATGLGLELYLTQNFC